MNIFNNKISLTLFGEAYSEYIGLTIDGLPSGIKITTTEIKSILHKNNDNNLINANSKDIENFIIVSGLFNDYTTGAPLTILLLNDLTKLKNDIIKNKGLIRPTQSDLTAFLKYNGYNDYRDGGMFNGIITKPLLILGLVCKKILSEKNIQIFSHIKSLKNIYDKEIPIEKMQDAIELLSYDSFPVYDPRAKQLMLQLIKKVKKEKDSIGGEIETFILNCPPGLGNPFFDSFESILSHLIFSIPGVKGIEFGDGFDITSKYGSDTIDEITYKNDKIMFSSNHFAGINGGITNGNIINFTVAYRPPSTIAKDVSSIDVLNKNNIIISTERQYEVLICNKGIPIQEALAYYAVALFIIK